MRRNDKPRDLSAFLNIAVSQVQEKYFNATLVLAESTTIPPSTDVNSFQDLKHFAAVFNTGQGHVTVDSTEWGAWSPPVYSSGPWLTERVIDLENITLVPTKADHLLKAAGWTLQFNRVYLWAWSPLYFLRFRTITGSNIVRIWCPTELGPPPSHMLAHSLS